MTPSPAYPVPAAPASASRQRRELFLDLEELKALLCHVQERTTQAIAKLSGAPSALSRADLDRLHEVLTTAQRRVRAAREHNP